MDNKEHSSETYKSMISISVEALKSLLLINGGATVAMLSFLGASSRGATLVSHAYLPLSSFTSGIVFSVLAFACSYATQYALFNETLRPNVYKGPRHMTFVGWGLLFVFLGLVAFAVGCISSISALTHIS